MYLKTDKGYTEPCGDVDELTTYKIEVFCPKANDYLECYHGFWNKTVSQSYKVKLFGSVFVIPSHSYIVVGDGGGDPDIMLVEEVIGRNIPIMGVSKGYRTLVYDNIKVLDVISDHEIILPTGSHIIPLYSSNKKSFVLISANQNILGDLSSGDFVA